MELPEECKPERNEKFDDTTSLGKQAKVNVTQALKNFLVLFPCDCVNGI